MVFKTTSTKRAERSGAGFTLIEALMAAGVTALVFLVVTSVAMFSGRSFAALANYVELDDHNRIAMDQLTRDLRQCNRVTAATSTSLTLEDPDGSTISYNYSSSLRTLTRTKSGVSTVLLRGCDKLTFALGQRNAVGASYDVYAAATPETCKVVNVSWVCTRSIFGNKENSESVQTARIVIRKQGT